MNFIQWGMAGSWMSLFALAVLWSLVWKGIALWRAAQRKQIIWYIVLLVVNTLGILEIIYIFLILPLLDKKQKKANKSRANPAKPKKNK